jgi:hypothetical protein
MAAGPSAPKGAASGQGAQPPSRRPVVTATRAAVRRSDVPPLPLVVVSAPGLPREAVPRRGASPADASWRPVVQIEPARSANGDRPAPASSWWPSPPAPARSGVPVKAVGHEHLVPAVRERHVPVVREQVTRERAWPADPVTGPLPRAPLPLAEARTAAAGLAVEPVTSAAATSGASWRHAPEGVQVPARTRRVNAANPAQSRGRAAETGHPAAPRVDADRIIDSVHRRFLHRLAIEAERRGTAWGS